MNYKITPPTEPLNVTVDLPMSKSVCNRVLMLASLCPGVGVLRGLDSCDDVRAMQQGLRHAGSTVDVGPAGTAMRFLAARLAMMPGVTTVLDGNKRMRQRPMQPLITALRQLGANITCLGANGHAPMRIVGQQLRGGDVTMRGDVSSQFISALLMIAPTIGGVTLHILGELASAPYVNLTLHLMRQWGVEASWQGNTIVVPAGQYSFCQQPIEADWSAASYWMAMACVAKGSHVRFVGLHPDSAQPDAVGWKLFHGTQPNSAVALDMSHCPDLVPAMAVMLAVMHCHFRLKGLGTLRNKECDRLAALQAELRKLGYVINIEGDELVNRCDRVPPLQQPRIATHGDHRMAMAMTVAALRHPGLVIDDAQVVSKSYPEFWNHLQQAGFKLETI